LSWNINFLSVWHGICKRCSEDLAFLPVLKPPTHEYYFPKQDMYILYISFNQWNTGPCSPWSVLDLHLKWEKIYQVPTDEWCVSLRVLGSSTTQTSRPYLAYLAWVIAEGWVKMCLHNKFVPSNSLQTCFKCDSQTRLMGFSQTGRECNRNQFDHRSTLSFKFINSKKYYFKRIYRKHFTM
jgi:hypothetical protein